jgi:UDP-N-acetylglucosamine 2-epimerase
MTSNPRTILTVIGARPQFVKAAVISRYLRESGMSASVREILVHTGQHYDPQMSDVFFQELGIPIPKHNLEVGSAPGAAQLGRMVERLGPVVEAERPDLVLVYGDTHSTLAAGVVAAHMNIPLAHVEAGERIYRRHDVPEEVNRVLTDHAASLCLTCTQRATRYLLREGMAPGRVQFVGDPIYELFLWARQRVDRLATVSPATYDLIPENYFLATIHRAQNTRDPATTHGIFEVLDRAPLPTLLPVHPRVRRQLAESGWKSKGNLRLIDPLGYFDFMALLLQCRATVTDSGGVSRESYYAAKPCIVPMENCWWPEVVEAGWIQETGSDPECILRAMSNLDPPNTAPQGLFGDGRSAQKIIGAVLGFPKQGKEPKWHHLGSSADLPATRATDFTHEGYKLIISGLKTAGYRFLPFPEAERAIGKASPFVLMRHDIDISLEAALHLAEIEFQMQIQATYFFMVRTEFYNVFSRDGSAIIGKILDLGHHLGLHFDCAAYASDAGTDELATACRREAQLLESWFDRPVSAVSYHRPSLQVLSGNPALSAPWLHTYQSLFTGPITYLSDSRGCWRNGGPLASEAMRKSTPLHILVHPIWWNPLPVSPFEVLERDLDRRRDQYQQEMARNCAVYQVGRLREEGSR